MSVDVSDWVYIDDVFIENNRKEQIIQRQRVLFKNLKKVIDFERKNKPVPIEIAKVIVALVRIPTHTNITIGICMITKSSKGVFIFP
jgi:hypothetical protein